MHAGRAQACVDVQPRTDVFELRRCIHHDPAAVDAVRAPVAAEAGVGRGALERRIRVGKGVACPGKARAGAVVIAHRKLPPVENRGNGSQHAIGRAGRTARAADWRPVRGIMRTCP
jgi:hypothetical protein